MSKKIFLLFICFQIVFGLKRQPCTYYDEVCMTEAVKQHVYALFVSGVPGVERSDPMHLDQITVDLPDYVYKLQKPTVTGFGLCDFQKLKINRSQTNETLFDFEFLCPHLRLNSDYQVNNKVGAEEDSGKCEIVYNNYYITLKGKFVTTNDELLQPFIVLTEYTPILDLQKGAICKYDSKVDKGKTADYYNNMEERSRQFVMEKFMEKYYNNLKDFLIAIPIEDLHYRYV